MANTATSNACDSASGSPRVVRATVTVTWPDMRNTEPVRTATEITPPVGSYDPTNGHIAVRVRDRSAAPLGGVPVRVTGPGVDSSQTTLDDSGCAFFGFLPPGSYRVTLGTPGWVDRQSDAVPTQTVGVSAESISSVAFDYDRAATITATLAGTHGGTPANAAPVTVANTALLPAGTKSITGAGTVRSLTSLFPFASGLQAWTGICADADPEGIDAGNSRIWPGANRDPAISVDPGSTTTATVAMATVDLKFTPRLGREPGHDPGRPRGRQRLRIGRDADAHGVPHRRRAARRTPLGGLDDPGALGQPAVLVAGGPARPQPRPGLRRHGADPMIGRRRADQSGQSTLVEIAATLLLLAIVMTFVYSSIDSAERTVSGTQLRITNLDEARTLMAVLTKDVRTATRLQAGQAPFTAADSRDVTFYANLDNATGGPRKIRISVDASNEIIESVQTPDASSVAPDYTYTGVAKRRYVGRYLANTAAQPVFEYFDDAGTQLAAPLSASDRLAVNSVKITLVVRAASKLPVGNVTLVDQVRLPNVDYQQTGA